MKKGLFFVGLIFLMSCKQKPNIPDVSHVKVDLQTIRFEQAFFALDTNQLDAGLDKLNSNYPGFAKDFIFNILGSSVDSAKKDIPAFIGTYRKLYDSSRLMFKDLKEAEQQIHRGLQFVKYYFPKYPLPGKLVSFIGPINGYGNIITTDALAVGLQMYMGRNYSLYQTEMGQQLYPAYISRRFEPAYIPVNCIKNIIDDMYPNKSIGRPLVEQMIEAGKRQWLLNALLPEIPDSIRTGYTQAQLEGSISNEANIWGFFVQNNLLFESNPDQTKDYMNEAPNTPALGEAAPGMIGQFVGTRIVAKWMDAHAATTPEQLMTTPAKKIFEEAKYKPK